MNCAHCGVALQGRDQKKFCSQSCAAKYNKNRLGTGAFRRHQKDCVLCGKILTRSQSRFCSRKCARTEIYEEYIRQWLAGTVSGSQKTGKTSKRVKRYLLELYGYKCQRCGWGEANPYSSTIPLGVHHIDGFSANNRPYNLRLLCPNCHSLTEGWCGANAGKFVGE
jgi:predicted nucleic acid-binding Zn ribbon protein